MHQQVAVLRYDDLTTPAFAAGMGAFFILAGLGLLITALVLALRKPAEGQAAMAGSS